MTTLPPPPPPGSSLPPSAELVYACKSVGRAAEVVAQFGRAIWRVLFPFDLLHATHVPRPGIFEIPEFSVRRELERFPADALEYFDLLRRAYQAIPLVEQAYSQGKVARSTLVIPRDLLVSPGTLVQAVLQPLRQPDDVLKYYVARDIRRHFGAVRDGRIATLFRILAQALPVSRNSETWTGEGDKSLRSSLLTQLHGDTWSATRHADVELFLECCRLARYVEPGFGLDLLRIRTHHVDAEYLLSQLFGVPTGIQGLDELFGGAGIVLAEDLPGATERPTLGRAILIRGRFGTGKTLLASQLMASIVRKGGLARMVALEQPASDYLYMLSSFGALPSDTDVRVITDPSKMLTGTEREPGSERGTLIILGSIKDSFDDFRSMFEATGTMLARSYPLRVICVDPVNSVHRGPAHGAQRTELFDSIMKIKRTGTNVILVAEDDAQADAQSWFESNIVDTVIQLAEESQHTKYLQRYLQISKSRLQREQRGWHPYSIRPAHGFEIFPSPAAVNARIQSRRTGAGGARDHVRFGFRDLDSVLGPKALMPGELIAFRGASGSYKSQLGLMFLMARDHRSQRVPPKGLLITPGETEESVRAQLRSPWFKEQRKLESDIAKGDDGWCFLSPPLGYTNPAAILRDVEAEFEKARLSGEYYIDRVVVDNINHWELSCPFVRDDETFADTLINLLQRHNVTSLFICSGEEANVPIQRPFVDRAGCIVDFDRFEFRGQGRVALRVLKTRSMGHNRQAYEITFDGELMALNSTASMFRIARNGEVKMVPIRLFLHAESEAQHQYNDRLRATIQAVLSAETSVRPQSEVSIPLASELAELSAMDELQLVQLDEFQLSDTSETTTRHASLRVFCKKAANAHAQVEWEDFLPRLSSAVSESGDSYFAVPLYADIGLLAYRQSLPRKLRLRLQQGANTNRDSPQARRRAADIWTALADECEKWEKSHSDSERDGLFFEFSHVTTENYTCLFFEILDSFVRAPIAGAGAGAGAARRSSTSPCTLLNWIRGDDPGVVEACRVYWRLCHRAHHLDVKRRAAAARSTSNLLPELSARGPNQRTFNVERRLGSTPEQQQLFHVCHNAVVWRHWFSTASQMFAGMDPAERQTIRLSVLPGRSVAGEWYMAIPAYSAAPEVGVRILRQLTSRQANTERLHAGVGLPTRLSFYDRPNGPQRKNAPASDGRVAPNFDVGMGAIKSAIQSAFCRSEFGCYGELAELLAHHLLRLLEIPQQANDPTPEIRSILGDLAADLSFNRVRLVCSKCRASTAK